MKKKINSDDYYDIDVISIDGDKISRMDICMPPRKCLICGKTGHGCSRNRTHSIDEMTACINQIIKEAKGEREACRFKEYQKRNYLRRSSFAYGVHLLKEVGTTPKPGLVDLHDTGAHKDMDYDTFVKSTYAIKPYILRMAVEGFHWNQELKDLFPHIREIGKQAEQAMFQATRWCEYT